MTGRDVVRRLAAYAKGEPIPRGSTIHLMIPDGDDLLVMAFVRMGGESLPWGVGFVRPGAKPLLFSVPDPRNRERVVEMLTSVTPTLAAHFDSPHYSSSSVTSEDALDQVPLRQLWMPNGAHVDMLHMLNLRYTFAQQGDPVRAATLRALGRVAGYLFREASRPGEATIIDATAALGEAFTFPADDLRQQHLGFLLALLGGRNREQRFKAAEEAEGESVSTSLDPKVERDELGPLVARYTAARRAEDAATMKRAADAISVIVERELVRRLDLTLAAIGLLSNDTRQRNRGAVELAAEACKTRQRDYLWLEEQLVQDGDHPAHFPASPETDRDPRTAAARYHKLSGASEGAAHKLVHFDAELQAEAIADGDATLARIVKVENRGRAGSREVKPVWLVETDAETSSKLRKGSSVSVAGVPGRSGKVLEMTRADGVRSLLIEITGWKTPPNSTRYPHLAHVPSAVDPVLELSDVLLLPSSLSGISERKRSRVRNDGGVGAWLTHGSGSAPASRRRAGGDVLAEVEALKRR